MKEIPQAIRLGSRVLNKYRGLLKEQKRLQVRLRAIEERPQRPEVENNPPTQTQAENSNTGINWKFAGSLALLVAGGFLTFVENRHKDNRKLLHKITEQCHNTAMENRKDRVEFSPHIIDCQPRLFFYNKKNLEDIAIHKKLNALLNRQKLNVKLIQNSLDDLIKNIQIFPIFHFRGWIEKVNFKRADELLKQQKRQYYRLVLAENLNSAILLHKQGQYDEALQKIEGIKNISFHLTSSQEYKPNKKDEEYLPQFEDLKPLETDEDCISMLVNTYNTEGMILRSRHSQSRTKNISDLENAQKSFGQALSISNQKHPVVLSNYAFLLMRLMKAQKEKSPSEIQALKEKAAEAHKKAYASKYGDINDIAILNRLGFAISKLGGAPEFKIAFELLERAIRLTPQDQKGIPQDLLENKAFLLIKMYDCEKPDWTYLEKAEKCLEQIISTPGEHADAYYLLAKVAHRKGRFSDGIAYLKRREDNLKCYPEQLFWRNDEEKIQGFRKTLKDKTSVTEVRKQKRLAAEKKSNATSNSNSDNSLQNKLTLAPEYLLFFSNPNEAQLKNELPASSVKCRT